MCLPACTSTSLSVSCWMSSLALSSCFFSLWLPLHSTNNPHCIGTNSNKQQIGQISVCFKISQTFSLFAVSWRLYLDWNSLGSFSGSHCIFHSHNYLLVQVPQLPHATYKKREKFKFFNWFFDKLSHLFRGIREIVRELTLMYPLTQDSLIFIY